jgi:glutaredoxin
MRVTDWGRAKVYEALSSTAGDQFRPLKLTREVLATANDLLGRPFCPTAELNERRVSRPGASTDGASAREAAPVMLYFDGRDHRTKKKMEELLRARDVPFKLLDVTDDEATRIWAAQAAKQTEFPLLFIAGVPVGGLHELTQLDVNGQLVKKVFG